LNFLVITLWVPGSSVRSGRCYGAAAAYLWLMQIRKQKEASVAGRFERVQFFWTRILDTGRPITAENGLLRKTNVDK